MKNNEFILCKHLIACRLSERMKKCKYRQVNDAYLISLFKFQDSAKEDANQLD